MKNKTTYTILAYEPGTEVYAISFWCDGGATSDHLAIYKAKVQTWTYDAQEKDVVYYLETPKEGKWWGTDVKGEFVSENFDDLLSYAKELWKNEEEN